MQQAGHANGITVEYLGLPQYPELLKTGEVVQQQLKQIGINMRSSRSTSRSGSTTSARGRTRSPRVPGADDRPRQLLLAGAQDRRADQRHRYANPAFDKLIDQASHETDEATRKALY